MSSKKNIKINNILVIGLGLIGASLCRSLKSISLYKKIYGHDTSEEVMQYALKNNFFIGKHINFLNLLNLFE